MNTFEKILSITSDAQLELSSNVKEVLHKELQLGMSNFVCRWGTLSDAFDKLTDSQRYYQANKEVYQRHNEAKRLRANAKAAYADLLEARKALELNEKNEINGIGSKTEMLRAQSAHELAELRLFELLVSTEDTMRQLNAFNDVRLELKDKVRAQYPGGIEEAELDNWRTVAEYKATQKQMGLSSGPLNHMPLPPKDKAQIGLDYNAPEMAIWHLLQNKDKITKEFDSDASKFLESSLKLVK